MAPIYKIFLRFEDWSLSMFLQKLNEVDIEDRDNIIGDRIIKVYPSDADPRELYGIERNIAVVQIDSSKFSSDEIFTYPGRGAWTGEELNQYISEKGLSEEATAAARALFRFSNLPKLEFCQRAMELLKSSGGFLINHPFEEIDGFHYAISSDEGWKNLHLDIFLSESLKRLFEYLDPSSILSFGEARKIHKKRL